MASEGLLLYRLEEGGPALWLLLERKKLVKPERLERAHRLFDRYGPFALLLSWMPVIGDPITFAAGIARFSFLWFSLLVLAAKGGRYLVLAAGWHWGFG